MKIRVGFGFDVHQLEKGKDLFLGGMNIPSDKGAVGHSDADVLIHAICDALLGAAGLRDIGFHYSNTDDRWKGMASSLFLTDVIRMIGEKGWSVENVDCTITLENPKINPHIPAMKKILAPLLKVDEDDVSLKATTSETMGYVGRGDGINAYAVVLIKRT